LADTTSLGWRINLNESLGWLNAPKKNGARRDPTELERDEGRGMTATLSPEPLEGLRAAPRVEDAGRAERSSSPDHNLLTSDHSRVAYTPGEHTPDVRCECIHR
jgi:hypothetical protein